MMHKPGWSNRSDVWSVVLLVSMAGTAAARTQQSPTATADPAALVNPLIGTPQGGNDHPRAPLPPRLPAWSPQQPRKPPRPQVEGAPRPMPPHPETGSTEGRVKIDVANGIVSGSVPSGNFCGYLGTADRRSYYTLYFVAHFDAPFLSTGTWQNSAVRPNTTEADGGTTYGPK